MLYYYIALITMNLKPLFRLSFVLGLLVLLNTSCASIVSKSQYPVYLSTQPVDSEVTIKNRQGFTIYQGKTPASVMLPASAGFFKKASYDIEFKAEGYKSLSVTLDSKLDQWYLFGNIFLLPLAPVGWLVLDPATGAMYKIPVEYVNELLVRDIGGK